MKQFASCLVLLLFLFFLPACAGVNGDRFEPESLLALRGKPREEVIEALGLKAGKYTEEVSGVITIEGQKVLGATQTVTLYIGPMDAKKEKWKGLCGFSYRSLSATHEEAFQLAKSISERFDQEYGIPKDFYPGSLPDIQPRLSSFSSYEEYRASEERPLTELWEPCEGWRIESSVSTPGQFPEDYVVTRFFIYDPTDDPYS